MRRRLLFLLAAFVVLSCTRHRPILPMLEFKTTPVLLDTIPPTVKPEKLQFSPDGTEVAYRWRTDDGRQGYAINGRVERYFDEVGEFIHYTRDGTHYAYHAKKAFKELVMFDGTEGELYDQVTDPVLSLTGRSLAYAAKQGDQAFVVFNGQEGAKDFDLVGPPILSSDGKHIAYPAKQLGRWFYVIDGHQEKPFDEVGYGYFSDEAKATFAYEARRGLKWLIVIGGKESAEYDKVGLFPETAWSGIFSAGRDGKEFVVVDGKEGPPYDHVGWPAVSEEGGRVAYDAKKDKKSLVVWNGVEGAAYDSVGRPVLSRNGKQIAYDVTNGREFFLVKNKGEIKRYIAMPGPRFSPDGKLAYGGVNDDASRKFVVEDNVKGQDYAKTGLIAWSDDGRHLAYAAGNGEKEFLVVDGKEGKPYDKILSLVPRFSPDGKLVGANAMAGQEVWWIVESAE